MIVPSAEQQYDDEKNLARRVISGSPERRSAAPTNETAPREEEEPFSEGFWAGRMSDLSSVTAGERERAYRAYRAGERWNRNDGDRRPLQQRIEQPEAVGAVARPEGITDDGLRAENASLRSLLDTLSQELERLKEENQRLLTRSGKPDVQRDFSIHAATDRGK